MQGKAGYFEHYTNGKEVCIMNIKKIIIIIILLVIIASALCLFFYCTTGYQSDTDEKNSIKNTIETVFRIQHGLVNKNRLKDISTKDFQENLDEEAFYSDFKIYMIDRNFMKSYEEINQNTVEVDCWVEGVFGDSYIAIITLTKTLDGKYLISNIQHDI